MRSSSKLYEVWSNRLLSCYHYPSIGKTVLVSSFHFPYLSSNSSLGDPGRPSLNIDGLAFQKISGVINSRQLSLFNRQYRIEIDPLHDLFKGEIIDPWIRKLKEEGEKTLFGITETSFMAAKDWMTSSLRERESRYKRKLEKKDMLVGEGKVERLTAVYSNLLAAEEALGELFIRVKTLPTHVDRPNERRGRNIVPNA